MAFVCGDGDGGVAAAVMTAAFANDNATNTTQISTTPTSTKTTIATCKMKCQKTHKLKTNYSIKCSYINIINSNCYATTAAIILIVLNIILTQCDAFVLDGSQNSYARFRKWYTGLNGSLEFEFKTEQPNGLVLYTDDGGTYDFFEVKLVEGAVRLRYNLGGGANIITVGRELHDGHWHKVQVCILEIIFLNCMFIFHKKN